MSQKKIRLVVSLMTLALLGLIAFQAYWLGFMLETKKEQFAVDVQDGLAQVVRKLEKQELVMLAQRQRSYESQQQKIKELSEKLSSKKPVINRPKKLSDPANIESHGGSDLIARNRIGNFSNEIRSDIMYVRKSFMLPNGQIAEITEEYQVNVDPEQEMQRRQQEEQQLSNLLGEVDASHWPNGQIGVKSERRKSKRRSSSNTPEKPVAPLTNVGNQKKDVELNKVIQKTALAKEVFSDYLFKERPINERVEPHYIDSLLRKELADKHIALDYSFGIGTASPKQSKDWIYASNATIKRQPVQFMAALFPNDLHNSGQFLHVHFPDTMGFIWQTMGVNLLGSAVLLFIMIGCFYIALMTIIRQKKLAEIKNDFINNMTHEFKTPISTISLATQLIQEDSSVVDNGTIQRYLGIIKDENVRLGQQVERVLQTAQMEREEIILKKKNVEMHELIQQVIDMNQPMLMAKQGTLTTDFTAQPSQILIDEVHMSNVLNNLIDNAVKYSNDQPVIHIETSTDSAGLHLIVSDQGIGMQKDVLGQVFEPFYRVPTGNVHNVKGFGLGLSYVKKIVVAHGGNVFVKSQLGKGSTFEITIPYGNES
jgi:two-component system phosphate regulon sensor histidine kinase PhoR